jgi:hypothetical protein
MSKLQIPSISNYGDYSSDNYGAHTLLVDFGTLEIYYSYKTIVAFRHESTGLVVSQNQWGTTTGKHLNWINDDKSARIPHSELLEKLNKVLNS